MKEPSPESGGPGADDPGGVSAIWRRRPWAFAAAGLLLFLGAGLLRRVLLVGGGPGHRERWRLSRLLGEPAGDLDQRALYGEIEVGRVSFRSAADAAGWAMGDGSPLPGVAGGIPLPAEQATRRVVGAFGREADEVDIVEIEVDQPTPSGVTLLWPRKDGRFVADNARGVIPGPGGRARIELASHPAWRGRIARIAVQPSASAQPVRLRGIRLLAYRLEPGRALAVPEGVRVVELDGDSRPALAVVEGRATASKPVRVPPGARLRFALGLPQHVAASARFVLGLSGDGVGDARLLEVAVRRSSAETGWSEHEVDLAPWAGRTVSFAIRIEPGGSAPIGFWGHPLVRWPARDDTRPNVLLISADTLRADHLSLYGYGRPTSPNLERWARRRGVVFRSAVASSPWTVPSHVSMFTGVDAHRHGVSRQGPIPRELPVLAESFRDAGYLTLASTGGGLVGTRFGFGRGFDVYRARDATPATAGAGELERGVEDTLKWLDRHAAEPFFVFFHTYATHTPLEAREPYWSRVRGRTGPRPEHPLEAAPIPPDEGDGFQRRYRFVWKKPLPDGAASAPAPAPPALDLGDPHLGVDLYDAAIARLDDQLGRLLDRLRSLGLERDTIVVFTSDHGESLGENGLWSHTHLLDSNLMIPLVVAPRSRGWPRSLDHQVRLIDVAPTILELAGRPVPPAIGGRSLVPLLSGATRAHPQEAWAYSSRTNWGLGLRMANRRKLIVPNAIWPALRGRNAFYDLEADPREEANRAGSGGADYDSLLGLVARELPAVDRGVAVTARCERAPCFEGVLRGLGAERDTVSSPDLACACVEPVPGGTRLRLRPGDAFTILYEDVLDGELRIDVRSAAPPPRRKQLARRVGPGQARFSLRLEPSGWRLDEAAAGPPPVGIHVAYTGSAAAPRPELAREMQDRLRALGYIE
jgi:arylsulfatase A-like enzyme